MHAPAILPQPPANTLGTPESRCEGRQMGEELRGEQSLPACLPLSGLGGGSHAITAFALQDHSSLWMVTCAG